MTEVVAEVLEGHEPARIGVLTGPNLAREVAAGQPTATVVAMRRRRRSPTELQQLFMAPTLRVYTNPDVVGCEIAGALKNVLAIGAGIADGLGYGDNTKAALITRGLAELARLGVAMGGDPLTFAGLAGMGDLIATCSSPQSRNRHVGVELGTGRTLDEIVSEMNMVAEGVKTTAAVLELAARHEVEMPLAEFVGRVLYEGARPGRPRARADAAQGEARAARHAVMVVAMIGVGTLATVSTPTVDAHGRCTATGSPSRLGWRVPQRERLDRAPEPRRDPARRSRPHRGADRADRGRVSRGGDGASQRRRTRSVDRRRAGSSCVVEVENDVAASAIAVAFRVSYGRVAVGVERRRRVVVDGVAGSRSRAAAGRRGEHAACSRCRTARRSRVALRRGDRGRRARAAPASTRSTRGWDRMLERGMQAELPDAARRASTRRAPTCCSRRRRAETFVALEGWGFDDEAVADVGRDSRTAATPHARPRQGVVGSRRRCARRRRVRRARRRRRGGTSSVLPGFRDRVARSVARRARRAVAHGTVSFAVRWHGPGPPCCGTCPPGSRARAGARSRVVDDRTGGRDAARRTRRSCCCSRWVRAADAPGDAVDAAGAFS